MISEIFIFSLNKNVTSHYLELRTFKAFSLASSEDRAPENNTEFKRVGLDLVYNKTITLHHFTFQTPIFIESLKCKNKLKNILLINIIMFYLVHCI
jgi:hypothetical protein